MWTLTTLTPVHQSWKNYFQLRNSLHGERTFLSLAHDFPLLWYSCIEYDGSVRWRAGKRIFQFARWFVPDSTWVTFQTSNTKQHFNLEAKETKNSLFWRETQVLFQQHVNESLIIHRYNVYYIHFQTETTSLNKRLLKMNVGLCSRTSTGKLLFFKSCEAWLWVTRTHY